MDVRHATWSEERGRRILARMKIQYRDFFIKHLPDNLPLITAAQVPIPATARQVVPQGKDRPKKKAS